jgi:hypothetical protein
MPLLVDVGEPVLVVLVVLVELPAPVPVVPVVPEPPAPVTEPPQLTLRAAAKTPAAPPRCHVFMRATLAPFRTLVAGSRKLRDSP